MKQTGNDSRIKTGHTSTSTNAALIFHWSLATRLILLRERAKAGVTGPTGSILLSRQQLLATFHMAATWTRYALRR